MNRSQFVLFDTLAFTLSPVLFVLPVPKEGPAMLATSIVWANLKLAGVLFALIALIMSAYAGLLWFVLGGRT